VGGGLVGEYQRRIESQSPSDRNPLLLTAGELAGSVAHPLVEADVDEELFRPVVGLALLHAGAAHRERDVLYCGETLHEIERLEHDPDSVSSVVDEPGPVEAGRLHAAEGDRAGRRFEDRAQAREQRALATARRPEEQREVAGGHLDGETVDRAHDAGTAVVLDDEVGDGEIGTRSGLGRHDQPPKATAGGTEAARRAPASEPRSDTINTTNGVNR